MSEISDTAIINALERALAWEVPLPYRQRSKSLRFKRFFYAGADGYGKPNLRDALLSQPWLQRQLAQDPLETIGDTILVTRLQEWLTQHPFGLVLRYTKAGYAIIGAGGSHPTLREALRGFLR